MEPANLTPLPPERDPLDAWLSAKAPVAPLPDEGFTTRVLAALPPPQNSFSWGRLLLYAAGALSGLAVAWWHGSGGPSPAPIFTWWNGVAAQTVYRGPWDDIWQAYSAMLAQIARRGYEVCGPVREFYLVDERDTDDPQRYLTEITWPVQTRAANRE